MDYKKKGDEELDLVKDDSLRVFKRYNHWSYVCVPFPLAAWSLIPHVSQAVKEEGGDRGWVPVSRSFIHRVNGV
jgi:bZIP factor